MTSWRNSPCVRNGKGMSLSGYVDTGIKGMAQLGRISVHIVFGGIAHSTSSSATAGDHGTMAMLRSTGFSLSRECHRGIGAHYWLHFSEIRLDCGLNENLEFRTLTLKLLLRSLTAWA